MIYSISGTLKAIEPEYAVIDANGIGYVCYCSAGTLSQLPKTNTQVELFTHFYFKQDIMQLFGFLNKTELELFKKLIGITGIGPKGAMAMLSAIGYEKIAMAIVAGDAKQLKAPGIGAKTAQRVILELRDKLDDSLILNSFSPKKSVFSSPSENSVQAEAIAALSALGYSRTEAVSVISKLGELSTSEEIIKEALKLLAKL